MSGVYINYVSGTLIIKGIKMKVISYDFQGNKTELVFDSFTFSGGEEHIRFSAFEASAVEKMELFVRLTNSSNIMQLMLAVDALRRMTNEQVPLELVIPYFPYARQDRVCVHGESLGAVVMASIINNLHCNKVTIWDAHSDVSPALLHKSVNISQETILECCNALKRRLSKGELTLISPDAGASKKTLKIAEAFHGEVQVIQAQKIRNLKTGDIIKTEVLGDVCGKKVLIVDDICDGGRTFIELAKVLKEKGALEISLFVTHGIFSKGVAVFDGLIDAIYTTDSFRSAEECNGTEQNTNLHVIEI